VTEDPHKVVDLHPWAWRSFQFSVFIAFMLANIYFEWGIEGIAAPVMGGMLAWYGTCAVIAVLERLRRQEGHRE
jgi:hypothetical protein